MTVFLEKFGAQFGEFENVYKIAQETVARRYNFKPLGASLITLYFKFIFYY